MRLIEDGREKLGRQQNRLHTHQNRARSGKLDPRNFNGFGPRSRQKEELKQLLARWPRAKRDNL